MKLVFAILITLAGYIDYVAAPCFRQQETAWCSDKWQLAPYRYRALVPMLEYAFIPNAQYLPDDRGLTPFGSTMPAVLAAIVVQALALTLFFILLSIWLKRIARPRAADMGIFLTAGLILIAYHRFQFALDTTVEAAGVAAACLLLQRMTKGRSEAYPE